MKGNFKRLVGLFLAATLFAAPAFARIDIPPSTKAYLGLATSTTDNAVVRADGTTGNTQNSGVIISDTNAITGTTGIVSTYTDVSTARLTDFAQVGTNGRYLTTRNPPSISESVIAAVYGENVWTSSFGGDGDLNSDGLKSGHQIGLIGRVDFTGTGDPWWMIGVEGRCDNTGNGVEDATFVTLCTSFAATIGADAGSTGNTAIYVGYYVGDMVQANFANITSAAYSFFSDSSWLTLRNDGNIQTGGRFIDASGTTSIAAGAGAGTGPTISLAGKDSGGKITLTTGTTPTANATIATVTYANACPNGSAVVLQADSTFAAAQETVGPVLANGTTTGFVITAYVSAALTGSQSYIWHYVTSCY